MPATPPTIPVLAAPTASGKTAAVLRLAAHAAGRGLEVVSADALQVYRGFDIGTAKPTPEERARVPHHLVDAVPPEGAMDAVAWTRAAEAVIDDALARGASPLVIAGTGFYLDALDRGLPTTPASDPAVRAALEAERAARGDAALLADLRALAPADAAASQGNPRRVLRALEVLRSSGRPPSAFPRTPPRFALRSFVALPSAAVLEARVDARVAAMLAAGWLDEVAALAVSVPATAPAWQAIGYAELARVVRGETTLEDATAAIALATRRYAKRQRTWFGRRPAAARRVVGTLDDVFEAFARWWSVSGS
ncbi:MAG: tRNA (adenosine(37)-N6)-dimethylallyltransferase MiaA [Trueperaceae bacterium]